ncbi:hypothetical protein OCK02_17135 [Rhizobium sp. TRM96647]|uniref:hypothetical protein n=1 Tax=Rhizobium sp. TRM96647 TaxID=2979861 RepID=UPI0021E73FF7|nr:hypothetical protein [Rhizobium sp. TRM96647]MCV3737929.1 hypothetical protein [Rhizobium sp. TRM96647]
MSRKAVSQFVIAPPTRRVDEFVGAQDRFSAYLSDHFPGYEFRVAGNSPFRSDDFHVVPIMGDARKLATPDGRFEMLAPPERALLDEILQVCHRFDVSKSRLS